MVEDLSETRFFFLFCLRYDIEILLVQGSMKIYTNDCIVIYIYILTIDFAKPSRPREPRSMERGFPVLKIAELQSTDSAIGSPILNLRR